MPCGHREDTDTQREGGHRPQTKPRVGPQTLPEDREGPPAEAARGARPRRHLAFGRVAPRTVRKDISVVLSHPLCGAWQQQSRGRLLTGLLLSIAPEDTGPWSSGWHVARLEPEPG